MRVQFCDAMVAAGRDPSMIFMTGDLGLQGAGAAADGDGRAIRQCRRRRAEHGLGGGRAGAAGPRRLGLQHRAVLLRPAVRADPQRRLLHNLPVRLVGNGGGYGYGVMGPTHHALEDYGVLALPVQHAVYVPVFDEDLAPIVDARGRDGRPGLSAARPGRAAEGLRVPRLCALAPAHRGDGPVVIAVGPLAGRYVEARVRLPRERRPNLWAAQRAAARRTDAAGAARATRTCGPLCASPKSTSRGAASAPSWRCICRARDAR